MLLQCPAASHASFSLRFFSSGKVLSFSASLLTTQPMFFFGHPSHAAGSHIAGPVVPTVPFWKSLSSVARQPNLTKFPWLHSLSMYAPDYMYIKYIHDWLCWNLFILCQCIIFSTMLSMLMLYLQSQETLPSEPPWRVARLRSQLPVWSFEPLGPPRWEAQGDPCLFRGSSLNPFSVILSTVNSLPHDMKVRE